MPHPLQSYPIPNRLISSLLSTLTLWHCGLQYYIIGPAEPDELKQLLFYTAIRPICFDQIQALYGNCDGIVLLSIVGWAIATQISSSYIAFYKENRAHSRFGYHFPLK